MLIPFWRLVLGYVWRFIQQQEAQLETRTISLTLSLYPVGKARGCSAISIFNYSRILDPAKVWGVYERYKRV